MSKKIFVSLILLLTFSCTTEKLEISWAGNNSYPTVYQVFYWEGKDTLSCPIRPNTDINLLQLYKVTTTVDTNAVKRIMGRRVDGMYVRVGVIAQVDGEFSELALTPFYAYDDL